MTQKPHNDRYRVCIVGAGRIGTALALHLKARPDIDVVIADFTESARAEAERLGLNYAEVDARDTSNLAKLLTRMDSVVAALPSAACVTVAAAARQANINYLDLCDESANLEEIRAIGASATSTFVPQCGLSPGLVSTLTLDLVERCGAPREIVIRTGTLPRNTTNRLGYGLTWNVDALIAEYLSPSIALRHGKRVTLAPLSELESLNLDGRPYEAFVAGNVPIGLCERFDQAQSIVAKSIRYPGHLNLIQFLIEDFKLSHRPDILRLLMANGLPEITDDQFIIALTIRALRDRREVETTWLLRAQPSMIAGESVGALRGAAASHVAAMLDLIKQGTLNQSGLVRQEDVPVRALLDNPFLSWLYAGPNAPRTPEIQS